MTATALPAPAEPPLVCCRKTTEQWPPFCAAAMGWECRFVARGSGTGLSGGAVVETGSPAGW